MKNKDNLYVGVAYSALDVGYEGVMSQEWAEIGGHKCLGTFLLEKVEDKKMFKKPVFKGFKEYRTKQDIKGIEHQFMRPDDLPLASECNEYFLHWFFAPIGSTDNMLNVEAYMGLPIEEIYKSLRAVEEVYEAGKKDELDLTQDNLKMMK